MSEKAGDFAVDIAYQSEHFHPHDTAPYVKAKLAELYPEHAGLSYFMTTRNPVDLLWSCYRFFKPDAECRYNFDPGWDETTTMEFEDWVQHGKLGMRDGWEELAPSWISTQNLSPLSLEAYSIDRAGVNHVDHLFRLENIDELNGWLSNRLQKPRYSAFSRREDLIPHVNQADAGGHPESGGKPIALSDKSLHAIRLMFPTESEMYGI
ncbi:hypothetical protein [Ruegeria arenilitoris]|uniref:hypothetical protein n=1 Tax=Ruegeria arenilitoris TaxID=1173585 RepID=UPI00147E3B4A|nr:hypothetical protein [Ruegeria arenilitoris]